MLLYSNVFGQPCGGNAFQGREQLRRRYGAPRVRAGGGRDVKFGRFDVIVRRLRTVIGGSSGAVHRVDALENLAHRRVEGQRLAPTPERARPSR